MQKRDRNSLSKTKVDKRKKALKRLSEKLMKDAKGAGVIEQSRISYHY